MLSDETGTVRGSEPARTPAPLAGVALALMAVLGAFAGLGVVDALYSPTDVERTARDAAASSMLLRWGALAFLVIALLDVVVAWALGVLLAAVHAPMAVLAAGLRAVYAAALVTATGFLLLTADLVEAGAAPADVHGSLASFRTIWDVGLGVFGTHLVLVGWLCLRSAARGGGLRVPRWIGALVILAGAGYLVDAVAVVLGGEVAIGQVTFVGEVVLLVWLLWFGLRRQSRTAQSRTTQSRTAQSRTAQGRVGR